MRGTADPPNTPGTTAGVNLTNDEAPDDAQESIQLSPELLKIITAGTVLKLPKESDKTNYICEATAYALYKADRTGRIHAGIFIHMPHNIPEEVQKRFAGKLVDGLIKAGVVAK